MDKETPSGNVILGHDPFSHLYETTFVEKHTWDGNRMSEGLEALGWSSAYASQQIDFPVNIVATDTARTTYFFTPYETVDVKAALWDIMLQDPLQTTGPWAGGAGGYPMRGSDDMRLMDEEIQMVQNWMLGAP